MNIRSTAKILLVEDNPGDARLLKEELSEVDDSFEIVHVVRLSEAIEMLEEGNIGLILLDLSLPDSQGMEAYINMHAKAAHIPIVIVTGRQDEEMAVKAVGAGAQDYIVKGQIRGPALLRSIRYAILRHATRAELESSKVTLITNSKDFWSSANFDSDLGVHRMRAEVFANAPISEYMPEMFTEFRDSYLKLVDQAIEQEGIDLSKERASFIEDLAVLDASPYDLLQIYNQAIKTRMENIHNDDIQQKASIVQASKHLIIELMTKMLGFYADRKKAIN